MARTEKLTDEQIVARLEQVPGFNFFNYILRTL